MALWVAAVLTRLELPTGSDSEEEPSRRRKHASGSSQRQRKKHVPLHRRIEENADQYRNNESFYNMLGDRVRKHNKEMKEQQEEKKRRDEARALTQVRLSLVPSTHRTLPRRTFLFNA